MWVSGWGVNCRGWGRTLQCPAPWFFSIEIEFLTKPGVRSSQQAQAILHGVTVLWRGHYWPSASMLGIWTPVFMLVQQLLLPTEPSPHLQNLKTAGRMSNKALMKETKAFAYIFRAHPLDWFSLDAFLVPCSSVLASAPPTMLTIVPVSHSWSGRLECPRMGKFLVLWCKGQTSSGDFIREATVKIQTH